jgi:hypothetical protein
VNLIRNTHTHTYTHTHIHTHTGRAHAHGQAEHLEWKAERKVGAKERHQFHKAAKKRVIKRLMRPTFVDAVLAALAGFAAYFASKKAQDNGSGSGRRPVGGKVVDGAEDTDLEAGEGGDDDTDEQEGGKRTKAPGASADSDSEDGGGSEARGGGGGGKGGARASSSRGSRGEKGLSEAETEADRVEPPDADSDDD